MLDQNNKNAATMRESLMTEDKKWMPSLLDREIKSDKDDAFGHRHFAQALESLIEAPHNQPPFSIGLLGNWGSGKSSIKAMYLKSLEDTRADGKIFQITFNAWRFGGENLKRALLRHVFLEIGGEKNALDDALFNRIEETCTKSPPTLQRFCNFLSCILPAPLQLFSIAIMLFFIMQWIPKYVDLSNAWIASTVTACITALGVAFVSQLPKLNKLLIAQPSSTIRIDAPRSTAEQYEDLLVDQLASFKKGTSLSGKGKKCERLVIFIDDLDRLSSEEMVTGLDAIRTFMEIPLTTKGMGIIFVISCDEDRVAEALYRSKGNATDMPAAVFNRMDARRYLDRIFQFRLEIPDFPKRDLRNFVMDRLKNDLPEIKDDLLATDVSLENVVDRMIHVGVNSPRNALQILNSFCQCWWIAKRRERDGAGTERAGGLQEGSVTKHPIALAAICALRVDFPDFFHNLQKEPDLIERFAAVFIRDEKYESQPESTQAILSEYSNNERKLYERYRPLRSFIASLGGLRWPPRLQPLLILTQDPITRRLGDKALPLHDAFVSDDHQQVLQLLGREKESGLFTVQEVQQLKDMVEDLSHETPTKRDNAAACIAALASRLPKGHAHHLLTPLARRLATSPRLRWQLGIQKIRSVLPETTAEDRQDVAKCLVEDLLKLEGDTDFQLESMQPPSIGEAILMAREACSLVLWVREKESLPEIVDSALLRWLEIRRIGVKGDEATLPFSDLEGWLNEYGNPLLLALKDRYTHLIAELLESNEISDLNIDDVIGRCKTVFEKLYEDGEESRRILWKQATRFVSARCQKAVSLAWQVLTLHTEKPNSGEITSFVASLAARLEKNFDEEVEEDKAEWELDWTAGAKAQAKILQDRADDLDETTQESIATLANAWSRKSEYAKYAVGLLNVLTGLNSTAAINVITDWIEKLFKDLPNECISWLPEHFGSVLNDSQKQQLMNQLEGQINAANISEQNAIKYKQIMSHFSPESLEEKTFQKHLNNLCQKIGDPSINIDFIKRVFPVIPFVIDQCSNAKSGQMLQDLFVNRKGKPDLFGWLHGCMAGYWPELDTSRPKYNPQVLFNEAAAESLTHADMGSMGGVLRSLTSMLSNEIIDPNVNNKAKLAELACKLWVNHSEAALSALQEIDATPQPEEIAFMLDGIDPNNAEQIENLKIFWPLIATRMDENQCVDTATEILSRPEHGNEKEPDLCFCVWVKAVEERQPALLQKLLAHDQFNDEQRKRVWLQVLENHNEFGQAFFEKTLPIGFSKPDHIETMRTILNQKSQVSSLLSTYDEKHELGKVLIRLFANVKSIEIQNQLLGWIKEIGADNVLKDLKSLRKFSKEEIDQVKDIFPGSRRHLKDIKIEE